MVYFPIVDLDKSNKTAFGEILTAQTTSLVHMHFDYNLNTEHIQTLTTGSGTISQTNNYCLLKTFLTTNSVSHFRSRRYASYTPGVGLELRITARWNTVPNAGCSLVGIGDSDSLATYRPKDGYFFGYDPETLGVTNFHIFRFRNGTQISVINTSFSHDKLDGTGPTGININASLNKINVFRIYFQWLSAGQIVYQIENPLTGLFQTFHEIQYANSDGNVSVYNPSFKVFVTSYNGTAAADYPLIIPCATIMLQGQEWNTRGLVWSRSGLESIGASVDSNIITIRNKTTYASKNNRTIVKILNVSFATDGTKLFIFKCIINGTITTPTYNDNNTNSSCVDFDAVGLYTVGTGRIISSYALSKSDNNAVDLSGLEIYIYAGETFTITAASSTGGDAFVSVVWSEDT